MNVFGILVAYRPDPIELIENLKIILPQVERLLIINNGEESLDVICHSQDIKEWTHWQLWENATNEGISRAYNRGIQEAIYEEAKYVVFFDQDSRVDPAMIQTLVADHRLLQERGIPVAGVGPWYQLNGTKERARVYLLKHFCLKKYHDYEKSGAPVEEVSFLISSGTLLSMQAMMTVGKMDENLFVDHVDTDWFLRAEKLGYRSFVSRGTTMHHSLGSSGFRPLFLKITIPIHNARRYRENFKNTIYLYRKHTDHMGWIISDFVRFGGLFIIHLLRLDFDSFFQSLIGTVEGFRMPIEAKSMKWINNPQ